MAEANGSQFGFLRALSSVLSTRADFARRIGFQFQGKRDLYETLGYDRHIHFWDMMERYHRGGIARRIVDAFPNATWRNPPTIREPEKTIETSRFEEEFNRLVQQTSLFHYLRRADSIAGIGHFGILVLGVRDGRSLDQPIGEVNGPEDVLFLSVYSEGHVQITQYDRDSQSPRFGKPVLYDLQPEAEHHGQHSKGRTKPSRTVSVHHSRVIHVTRNPLEDDIFGIPELFPVWNYLDDLDKIMGGSAEATWRTVDRGIQFNADKDAQLEDASEMEKQMDEYLHGMRRFLQTQGVEANVLDSQVPDPSSPFQTLANLISGTTEIPQRQLFGAESGQQAGEADERNFNARARERQVNWAEPMVVRPLVNRFINIGALPEPETQAYEVDWPDLSTMTDRERADVAARMAQAVFDLAQQGTQRAPHIIFTPEEFRQKFLPELQADKKGVGRVRIPKGNSGVDKQDILSELDRLERSSEDPDSVRRARRLIEEDEDGGNS